MTVNRRQAGIVATLGIVLVVMTVLGAGETLIRPARRPVGPPPEELAAQTVSIPVPGGTTVSGWYSPGTAGHGAVLLLHGVRSDRRSMLGRAHLLHRLGYAVLLVDLPAHGESTGDRITFGLSEGDGVRAALDFLRQRVHGERLGVIGVSLGAASFVLSRGSPAPDAVVLESMFPTIRDAVANRLEQRLGTLGPWVAPLLLLQIPLRLGIQEGQLRPIDAMASLNCPVLVAHGTADRHTTLAEAERIFAATREPKEFWAVEGAGHTDLLAHRPEHYKERVLPFLERFLHR